MTADTTDCPVCAYGDVEEIVLLEAQPAGPLRPSPPDPSPPDPSPIARVVAALAILIVVIVVISAALR